MSVTYAACSPAEFEAAFAATCRPERGRDVFDVPYGAVLGRMAGGRFTMRFHAETVSAFQPILRGTVRPEAAGLRIEYSCSLRARDYWSPAVALGFLGLFAITGRGHYREAGTQQLLIGAGALTVVALALMFLGRWATNWHTLVLDRVIKEIIERATGVRSPTLTPLG